MLKIENVKKIYEPFLLGKPLRVANENQDDGEAFYFKVSYNRDTDSPSIEKKEAGIKNLQKNDCYFQAEFGFHFTSNNFFMSHVFKLDLTQLKYELKEYASSQKLPHDDFKDDIGLLNPDNIATILSKVYPEDYQFFFHNDPVSDYRKIAEIVIRNRDYLKGQQFGF
jgi:hypothetical protein